MQKILALCLLACTTAGIAQNKTIVKTNLLGLPFRNYSLEVERTLTKRFSVGAAYRTMPKGSLPLIEQIINSSNTSNPDAVDGLRNIQLGGNAITAEGRIYLGKTGYGKGFYLGAFYRKSQYDVDVLPIEVDNGSGSTRTIKTDGNLKSNGGGLVMGVHFVLGKMISLDWQLLGFGAAKTTVEINGAPNPPLTNAEQADIREAFKDFDVPGVSLNVNVTANNVNVIGSGTSPMLRSALSIGIRF